MDSRAGDRRLRDEREAMATEQSGDTEYDDSYPTCLETYSTLRIFSDELDPEYITTLLGIEPTGSFRKGDLHGQGKLRRKAHGWFYCSETLSRSRDTRRHLDLLLAALAGKDIELKTLQTRGCETSIAGYWVSIGQGGPWLMPHQMLRLGALGIHIWWDVHFADHGEGGKSHARPAN
jgi:hypothetical protein